MTRLRTATELKRAMAREALHALARLRSTGVAPSLETAPILMSVWQEARDKLLMHGEEKSFEVFNFRGLKCLVSAVWNGGNLDRFYLRDRHKAHLLLAGTAHGPLLLPGRTHGNEASNESAAGNRHPFNLATEPAPLSGAGSVINQEQCQ